MKNKIKNGKIDGDLNLTDFDTLLIPEIFPFLNDIISISGAINARSATSLNLPQLQTSGGIAACSATSLNLPQLQTSGSIDAESATSVVIPKVLHSMVKTNGKLLEPKESDIHIKQESFKNYFRRNICLQL